MDGFGVLSFIKLAVPDQVSKTLAKNNLKVADVDKFIFHQASGMALKEIENRLEIDPARNFKCLADTGNTVSSSIPIALSRVQNAGEIKKDHYYVLCGFGVGLSWGTAILRSV